MITAVTGGVTLGSATVTVTPGAPSPSRTSVTVPNGAVDTPTEIAISLQDEFGNVLPDAKGQIAVSVSGANSMGSVGVDDLGGGSYRAVYTPKAAGIDQVSVAVAGRPSWARRLRAPWRQAPPMRTTRRQTYPRRSGC